jgi:uracil-DNA glycosylase family 4
MPDDPRAELASVAASLRAYLEHQQETGATGIPRKPRTRTTTAPEPVTAPAAVAPVAPVAPIAPVAPVVASPAPARTLPVIAEEVKACMKCALHEGRTNTVFSRGNPEAALCFVGEAPGADEDAQGLPFVGRAGQLLDKMIQAMGLDPAKDVYVCNIIKCRPPGNRRPEPTEIAACIPYLHEQLATIKPKVIVAMGNTAVGALLDTKMGITKIRGQWKLYRGSTPVMPTYHPSYLIRPSAQQVEAKKQAWEDLQAVMKELGLQPPKKK